MNSLVFRKFLPLVLLGLAGSASAVGFGDLRGKAVLGEGLRLEVTLLGAEKLRLDPACFRLVQPAGSGDLPWLKKASFSLAMGASQTLLIRTDIPLREPILQLAVQLGCGHEVSREYTLMASPVLSGEFGSVVQQSPADTFSAGEQVAARRPPRVRSPLPAAAEDAPRLAPRKSAKRSAGTVLPDRLILPDAEGVGEPSLRLATEILSGNPAIKEAQREILRLEFRMLMAMHEQAVSQMATAEKLRNMEGTLGDLQARAAEFAQRVEKEGAAPSAKPAVVGANVPEAPVAVPSPPSQPLKPPPVPSLKSESAGVSEWSFYGVLIGAALGLAGWLGWKRFREQRQDEGGHESPIQVPDVRVDPKRAEEQEELGGVDLPFEPAAMGMPMQVDVELDVSNESLSTPQAQPERAPSQGHDSLMSINATTLDEHFEANPVMELADIMLSFGRVKGAAQALQEYIDHNPQEALQPWIRLMDVYRMAGMRAEFETVARNLNLHFNVEVQSWDDAKQMEVGAYGSDGGDVALPVAPRPQCIEDLPRLMNTILELWAEGDVVGYMYQLLRDNRGGQRQGFSLPVVEDILFLIELKETANRMEVNR